MLQILKQPKWIILTIVLIIAIYAFINLSEWQFNRDDQRRSQNQLISIAMNKEPIEITDVQNLKNLNEWQPVEITGMLDSRNIRFARNRYLDSSLGFWVIAPLNTLNNQSVLVNLGFVPVNYQNKFAELSFPMEKITFKGWVRKMETHKVTPSDYPNLQIASISAKNFSQDVYEESYVQVNDSSTALKNIAFLPEPKLSSGPHFSYAIQWIIFAILLPIGWVILYRGEKIK